MTDEDRVAIEQDITDYLTNYVDSPILDVLADMSEVHSIREVAKVLEDLISTGVIECFKLDGAEQIRLVSKPEKPTEIFVSEIRLEEEDEGDLVLNHTDLFYIKSTSEARITEGALAQYVDFDNNEKTAWFEFFGTDFTVKPSDVEVIRRAKVN